MPSGDGRGLDVGEHCLVDVLLQVSAMELKWEWEVAGLPQHIGQPLEKDSPGSRKKHKLLSQICEEKFKLLLLI